MEKVSNDSRDEVSPREVDEHARLLVDGFKQVLLESPEFLRSSALAWLADKNTTEFSLGTNDQYKIDAYAGGTLLIEKNGVARVRVDLGPGGHQTKLVFHDRATSDIQENNRTAIDRVNQFLENMKKDVNVKT